MRLGYNLPSDKYALAKALRGILEESVSRHFANTTTLAILYAESTLEAAVHLWKHSSFFGAKAQKVGCDFILSKSGSCPLRITAWSYASRSFG
ncbi:hypothetical protein PoB_004294300 [Plakobranchus ocellatus]|uniref:Uncharacterized protein n=1 Tax=Plakobranchus ocellatus TaxID=259542 RepID=A0AAV4BC88_9GAST|nr:hypothetical protein PoB_004294300 [Plakobranchus ocellatus]